MESQEPFTGEWCGGKPIVTKKGLKTNMYRIVSLGNGVYYVEVRLQRDLIMKCELEHFHFVINNVFTGKPDRTKTVWYAQRAKGEIKLFHRLAYPSLENIDHINRDGLDNRKCNIRDGSGRVNDNNKRPIYTNNSSGANGVTFRQQGGSARWVAKWNNEHGKPQTKSFNLKNYGGDSDLAKQAAIEWRNKHVYKPKNPPSIAKLEKQGKYEEPTPLTLDTDIDFGEINYKGVLYHCSVTGPNVFLVEMTKE